jgi:hypothetical protein
MHLEKEMHYLTYWDRLQLSFYFWRRDMKRRVSRRLRCWFNVSQMPSGARAVKGFCRVYPPAHINDASPTS